MGEGRRVEIDKSVSLEEISLSMKRIKSSRLSVSKKEKALQKMGFIHLRYKDFSVEEAASTIGITAQTGYNWQNDWNRNHMDSIMPRYNGGRRSLISEDQRGLLRDMVAEKPLTTMEVADLIENEFGIRYSEKQVHVILQSLGFKHVSVDPTEGSEDSRRRMRWVE